MPVTTSRQRVLTQLGKLGRATARELARVLRMSEADIRHHLRALHAEGLVNVVHQRSEGRGRPQKVFGLSAALAGDNLAGLAEALLAEASDMGSLAARLLNVEEFAGQPVAKRLALLVVKLNAMHYQSRWEAGAEGPRLILGRCPYAALIQKHPELCRMDASLLENGLGRAVHQTARIEQGQGQCIFAVR